MVDLTIDLGNYNTIVTFRDGQERVHGLLKGVAREVQEFPGVLFIPSLVHMGTEILLGEEVLGHGLYEDEGCFRDIKDHILHPAPVARNVRGLPTGRSSCSTRQTQPHGATRGSRRSSKKRTSRRRCRRRSTA